MAEKSARPKRFNTTGLCVPSKHYMADISAKLEKIAELIDDGRYFTINRARQYGKTTTLSALRRALKDRYVVISISFEGFGAKDFETEGAFCLCFMDAIQYALKDADLPDEYKKSWVDTDVTGFIALSRHITKMCAGKKVLLMVDEVDKTSNNRVFLQLLSMLRSKYLASQDGSDHTFHSVILAGVYNIKNIKLKMINDGLYTPTTEEGKIYNSPWNIAADFDVDMSFNPTEIAGMLAEYEADYNTGMDIPAISEYIHAFTSGYPFLVSRICQLIDEKQGKDWSLEGVREAVNMLTDERNTLFDDIYKNLESNRKLYDLIYDVVIQGIAYSFTLGNPEIDLGAMYGILAKHRNKTAVSNRIFEIIISEYFISKNETANHRNKITGVLREDVVTSEGRFDMELCLRKFASHYAEIYSEKNAEFFERHGRLLFLTYLKPLINGEGFYHIESETRSQRRMDLVVDYGKDEFILELKIWHGEAAEAKAFEQLLDYMRQKSADTGYLLTFDLRGGRKAGKAEWVDIDGKRVFSVVV
jgi:hypothetical protein